MQRSLIEEPAYQHFQYQTNLLVDELPKLIRSHNRFFALRYDESMSENGIICEDLANDVLHIRQGSSRQQRLTDIVYLLLR